MFRAHPEAAAEAAGIKLAPAQLAAIMGSVKGLNATRGGGEFASRMWIDYTLVTYQAGTKAGLTDSAFIAAAMWADITELRGVRWHDSLVSRRGKFGPNTVDSVYQAGELRQLQHILIRADSGAPDSVHAKARKRADAVLARLRHGDDFGKVAALESDDPGSKFKQGILPVQPRGRWVKQFDDVGWRLAPGQLSGVFQTRFGYHIMRRPTFKESADAFHQYLLREVGATVDSTYLDSLSIRFKLEVRPDAASRIRSAMTRPDEIRDSMAPLATYTGGELALADLLRWANALPPQFTERLVGQSDSDLVRFVHVIGQNVLLLKDADSAGIKLLPEDWADLKSRYLAAVDTLKVALDIAGAGFTDSSTDDAARRHLAAARVDSFFARYAATGKRLAPIPFQLAPVLRGKYPHRMFQDGIDDALAQLNFPHADSVEAGTRTPKGAAGPPRPNPAQMAVPARPAPAKPSP
jgi:hypothetical protein